MGLIEEHYTQPNALAAGRIIKFVQKFQKAWGIANGSGSSYVMLLNHISDVCVELKVEGRAKLWVLFYQLTKEADVPGWLQILLLSGRKKIVLKHKSSKSNTSMVLPVIELLLFTSHYFTLRFTAPTQFFFFFIFLSFGFSVHILYIQMVIGSIVGYSNNVK